jgi:hypothetical protein
MLQLVLLLLVVEQLWAAWKWTRQHHQQLLGWLQVSLLLLLLPLLVLALVLALSVAA